MTKIKLTVPTQEEQKQAAVAVPVAAASSTAKRASSQNPGMFLHADSFSTLAHAKATTADRPYACSKCNLRFSRAHNLKSHQVVHTKEKPFQCEHCNQRFSRQHDLKRHERLHTGMKPYQCQFCSRQFSRLDALSRHLRTETSACPAVLTDSATLKDASSSYKAMANAQVAAGFKVPAPNVAGMAITPAPTPTPPMNDEMSDGVFSTQGVVAMGDGAEVMGGYFKSDGISGESSEDQQQNLQMQSEMPAVLHPFFRPDQAYQYQTQDQQQFDGSNQGEEQGMYPRPNIVLPSMHAHQQAYGAHPYLQYPPAAIQFHPGHPGIQAYHAAAAAAAAASAAGAVSTQPIANSPATTNTSPVTTTAGTSIEGTSELNSNPSLLVSQLNTRVKELEGELARERERRAEVEKWAKSVECEKEFLRGLLESLQHSHHQHGSVAAVPIPSTTAIAAASIAQVLGVSQNASSGGNDGQTQRNDQKSSEESSETTTRSEDTPPLGEQDQ